MSPTRREGPVLAPTALVLLTVLVLLLAAVAALVGAGRGRQDGAAAGAALVVAEARPGSDATVRVSDTEIGPLLADARGRTLYVFAPDQRERVTCTGSCLQAWPLAIAPQRVTVSDGLDGSAVATIGGPDGSPLGQRLLD
jgi:predicted lipoprotein with Yx(FWY)xxD motif